MEKFLSKEQKEAQQVSEISNLRYLQKSGNVPMVKANKDTTVEIPEIESKGYVFVLTTTRHVGADMKSINEIKSLIPIHANNFDRMVAQGGFALYDDVKIVHDPRKGAQDSYDFKVRQVNDAATEVKGDGRSIKDADMTAINESRKQLDAQKATLENKQAELANREADIKKREEELAAKEAAALSTSTVAAANPTFAAPVTVTAAPNPEKSK